MSDGPDGIRSPALKLISAWVAALGSSWDTAATLFVRVPWDKWAQFAAFLYSCCLLWEYLQKKRKKPSKGTDDVTE